MKKQDTVQQPQVEAVKQTDAKLIWDAIRHLSIGMFGLPNQIVEQHCKDVNIEPSQCYLILKSSSVLPALETTLAVDGKFVAELDGKYVVVKKAKPIL